MGSIGHCKPDPSLGHIICGCLTGWERTGPNSLSGQGPHSYTRSSELVLDRCSPPTQHCRPSTWAILPSVHAQSPPGLSPMIWAACQVCWICPFPLGTMSFPGGSVVKNLPANAGDAASFPGSGRVPGKGNGNPFQYSCLRNLMDGEAWQLQSMGSQKS